MSRVSKIACSLLCVAMIVVIAMFALPHGEGAYAAKPVLTVTQTETVVYSARAYVSGHAFVKIGSTEYENDLFDALTFRLDGEIIQVDPATVTFSSAMRVYQPGEYSDTITLVYDETEYQADVRLTVGKRPLIVSALLNGRTELTVLEGEDYVATTQYVGFAGRDNEDTLDAPAIITGHPLLPTDGYRIVPELASSQLYEFEYRAATLVILSNPDSERIVEDGETEVLFLEGSFSPYYELQYKEIGVSATSADYAAISDVVNQYYGTSTMFDKYNKSDCFSVDFYLDGNVVDVNGKTIVKWLLNDRFRGKDKYMLIHIPSDGSEPELITAKENEEGYLIFSSVGLGEYVLLTPVEGINVRLLVGIVIGVVAFIVLCVVFGALFRKKY